MASKDQLDYLRNRLSAVEEQLEYLRSYYDHRLICLQALVDCETDGIRKELVEDLNGIDRMLATLQEI